MKRAIVILYSVLFFGIPLLFFPKTSELFEFNKIVLLYAVTLGVVTLWAIECIQAKKLLFKRTILDIPLIVFLSSQVVSTIISIDQRTSLFGYYSRFNGGLISIACYLLLYWAFVTHIERKDLQRIFFNLLLSSTIAAVWGILEHFGKSPSCALITGNFDADCWVQDVQLRVFATFGQPNWMAAWMAAVIPITLLSSFLEKQKNGKRFFITGSAAFGLLTASLIFTKSKSGIAAFGVALIIFMGSLIVFRFNELKKQIRKEMVLLPILLLILVGLFGTPWTPTVFSVRSQEAPQQPKVQSGTALETGGTDSGVIRSIVWKGAMNVWRQYPVFGSGVETFAFSYYKGRPMSHNLTSEWNFLYNKAHNEYLNYLATTGIVGLMSYLLVIGVTLLLFYNVLKIQKNTTDFVFIIALLAGYISLLITNFFGFSVVPTSILFYLFPAAIISLNNKSQTVNTKKNDGMQILGIAVVSIISLYTALMLVNYWHADYLYARAQEAENNEDYMQSLKYYKSAIDLSPDEALYHAQLGSLYSDLTTAKEADSALIETFTTASINELEKANTLSPQNVRIVKLIANSYATLGDHDSQYLLKTLELTERLQLMAPTDPSVLYQECLTLAKLDHVSEAITAGETAISMKLDYKIARRLLAYLYEQSKQPEKARVHLEYILKYISPDDAAVQKELQSLPTK